MKEKAGVVFNIAADNPPIAGCTVSKEIYNGAGSYISHDIGIMEEQINEKTNKKQC